MESSSSTQVSSSQDDLESLVAAFISNHDFSTDEERWQATLSRNPLADGQFVYAVHSTRIFCRPTCPSRRPVRNRVSFFPTCLGAENAGFRPCKRCQPEQFLGSDSQVRQFEGVEAARRKIDDALADGKKPPTLGVLAANAGLSPFHFHRVFKARIGVTPSAYGKRKTVSISE